ncbi:Pyruvate formate-lyase activating enzyme [Caldibacillus thermoamylovorans]|uniref:pyruvate formate-lyase-activating protein n=1 Tax=Caldibacillus thermoamylovorans TaxID=35841 RepID=UPI0005A47CDA|nr:pyruvate formate-lyase-activating protein [Caldibacillus thermoamylovorans]KIO68764.1 Pyruvate formate-lyase activating enzyme [Caldibacillus thermoamylovorans]MCM3055848.1 pyruvate formate-lyase-activating protein [Caldibacillus thermoamylovorans]
MVTGRIHSVESFGAVDGPGLRYVVFTQGCLLRCQFCHNADTWKIGNGKEMTVQEIMDDVLSYLPFFEASGGGITVSGGEPLLQMDFLIELFKECKKHGIHTTIDSSGGPFNRRPNFMEKLDELLQYTDLILLDLKHIDSEKHKFITGMTNEHILDFAQYLSEKNIPVWIRHVLVPTLSDFDEDLLRLANFIKTLNNVEKIEVLPYHKLGVYKWESLGLEYKLKDVEPPSQERVENAKRILNAALAHA